MFEAQYYVASNKEQDQVQCILCPRTCLINENTTGDCKTRRNVKGKLISEIYGKIAALNLDPIEKKPLYHFYPGQKILSVGTSGCNLHCVFCQNYNLSQCEEPDKNHQHEFNPKELVDVAQKTEHSIGIAFTYNEPTVNFEFMLSTARLVKSKGLVTAMISNGYINPAPLKDLLPCIDAFNIDLKSFNNRFYRKYCDGKLVPVMKSINQIAEYGKHLEITNLVIPGLNDDDAEFESMCKWIAEDIGKSTVLHISRYFPGYRLKLYPTPAETLIRFYDIAKNYLHHVYVGNMEVGDQGDTFCPHCRTKMIERDYYHVRKTAIDDKGNCTNCGMNVIKFL